jgi:hypothetical protein
MSVLVPTRMGVQEWFIMVEVDDSDKFALPTAVVVLRTCFIRIDVVLATIGFYSVLINSEKKV